MGTIASPHHFSGDEEQITDSKVHSLERARRVASLAIIIGDIFHRVTITSQILGALRSACRIRRGKIFSVLEICF